MKIVNSLVGVWRQYKGQQVGKDVHRSRKKFVDYIERIHREKTSGAFKYLLATPPRCAIASSSWRLTRDVKKSWSDKLRVAWTQSDVKSATCNCAACKKHKQLRYKLLEQSEAAAKQEVSIFRKKLLDNHTWWLTRLISTTLQYYGLISDKTC